MEQKEETLVDLVYGFVRQLVLDGIPVEPFYSVHIDSKSFRLGYEPSSRSRILADWLS